MMMMRKEEEQHSRQILCPLHCITQHVGHIWDGRKRREGGTEGLRKKDYIVREGVRENGGKRL